MVTGLTVVVSSGVFRALRGTGSRWKMTRLAADLKRPSLGFTRF
jgi:hypothetical protein